MGNTHEKHKSNSAAVKHNAEAIDVRVEKLFTRLTAENGSITYDALVSYFAHSSIMKCILTNNAVENKTSFNRSQVDIDLQKAKLCLSQLCQSHSNSATFELYIDLLFDVNEQLEHETLENIVSDCFCFSVQSHNAKSLSAESKRTLRCIVNTIRFVDVSDSKKIATRSAFKEWLINEFPQLFYGYHIWLLKRVTDEKLESASPTLRTNDFELSKFMNNVIVWYFICNLPLIYHKDLSSENGNMLEKLSNCLKDSCWKLLYSSESHGLSLNRFQSNLFNYKAPTIIFIYCASGSLYCVCSTQEYKESPVGFGDDNTRIFRLWNNFKSFNVASSKNIYLNTKSRGLTMGLIFGYGQLKPTLIIDCSLHQMDHELMRADPIVAIEAWGCGSAKASLDQQSVQKWEARQIERMQTAKLDAEWSGNVDKTILDLAGIKTEHSERGDLM